MNEGRREDIWIAVAPYVGMLIGGLIGASLVIGLRYLTTGSAL